MKGRLTWLTWRERRREPQVLRYSLLSLCPPTPLSTMIEKKCPCLLLCAVDYVQRKLLRESERAMLHRAKLIAAARPELEQAMASH